VGAGGSKFCFVLEDGEEKNPKIESKESDVCCENISCCMPKRREAKLGRQRRTQLPTIETYQNMWTNSLPFPAENVMGLEDQTAISSAEADAAAAAAQTASEFFSSCLFIGPCGHVRPACRNLSPEFYSFDARETHGKHHSETCVLDLAVWKEPGRYFIYILVSV